MKHFVLIALYLFISIIAYGQSVSYDKITLVSGEVYIGTIVVKTNDFVMIKTTANARYQFLTSQIKLIEKTDTSPETSTNTKATTVSAPISDGNFAGMIEISEGIISATPTLTSSLISEATLCFGNKKVWGKNIFLGIGAGYSHISSESIGKVKNFIPIFLRLRTTMSSQVTSPFLEMNAGYLQATSATGLKGGPLFRIMAGISHQLNTKATIYTGIYANLNYFSGSLKYSDPTLSDSYYTGNGTTSALSTGLRLGLQF